VACRVPVGKAAPGEITSAPPLGISPCHNSTRCASTCKEITLTRQFHHQAEAGDRVRPLNRVGWICAILACVTITLVATVQHWPATRTTPQRAEHVHLVAAAQPASPTASSTPAPPPGDPRATMSSPADGTTVPAGTVVTLTASLSTDLVTALQAGSSSLCYFSIGDDANSTTRGTIDLTARTCTGTWTFSYTSAYPVFASVNTPSGITYSTPSITVAVSGGSDPRCTGQAALPASCTYHWTEVYYTSTNTRYARVCYIDGGCQWQTTHTSWPQVSGKDYWINSTGQPLPDGNSAEAYLCLGSAPTDWSTYTNTRDFAALLNSPETSASPIPNGTC
jgi:hypothetical protein